jgi:hypothetical protein
MIFARKDRIILPVLEIINGPSTEFRIQARAKYLPQCVNLIWKYAG